MQHVADISRDKLDLKTFAPKLRSAGLFIGLGGLALTVVLFIAQWLLTDSLRLAHFAVLRSYLANYYFVLTLTLGALFFVLIQHLTGAGWSVTVRRVAEFFANNFLFLAVAFAVFLLMGGLALYAWTDPNYVAHDELLQGKEPYLNTTAFLVRLVIYFAAWGFIAYYFVSRSVGQDQTADPHTTLRLQKYSAPAILAMALTSTFFAIDTAMALAPHWYSTMFGVYVFSGSMVGFFALMITALVVLQQNGYMRHAVTVEHYHDLGKFLFAFIVFWTYIGFSQYMLIWYANIPEEVQWFLQRGATTADPQLLIGPDNDLSVLKGHDLTSVPKFEYSWMTLVLLFGHFLAPFALLVGRWPKRRPFILVGFAVWMLAMHWLDMMWLIKPSTHKMTGDSHTLGLHLLDFSLLATLGGFALWSVAGFAGRHALIPRGDPRLNEALSFENF